MPGPANTCIDDSLQTGKPSQYISIQYIQTTWVNPVFHSSEIGKLSNWSALTRVHLCQVAGNTVYHYPEGGQ